MRGPPPVNFEGLRAREVKTAWVRPGRLADLRMMTYGILVPSPGRSLAGCGRHFSESRHAVFPIVISSWNRWPQGCHCRQELLPGEEEDILTACG